MKNTSIKGGRNMKKILISLSIVMLMVLSAFPVFAEAPAPIKADAILTAVGNATSEEVADKVEVDLIEIFAKGQDTDLVKAIYPDADSLVEAMVSSIKKQIEAKYPAPFIVKELAVNLPDLNPVITDGNSVQGLSNILKAHATEISITANVDKKVEEETKVSLTISYFNNSEADGNKFVEDYTFVSDMGTKGQLQQEVVAFAQSFISAKYQAEEEAEYAYELLITSGNDVVKVTAENWEEDRPLEISAMELKVYRTVAEMEEPEVFKVEFNANGGAPTPETQNVKKGERATKPNDPVMEGFDFKGWYTDLAFKFVWDFNTLVDKDMVLIAKWEKKTVPSEPDSTEPEPTDPEPTEPEPTEPKPTEPEPTDPKDDELEKPPWEKDKCPAGSIRLCDKITVRLNNYTRPWDNYKMNEYYARVYEVNPKVIPDYESILKHYFDNYFPWHFYKPIDKWQLTDYVYGRKYLKDCTITIDVVSVEDWNAKFGIIDPNLRHPKDLDKPYTDDFIYPVTPDKIEQKVDNATLSTTTPQTQLPATGEKDHQAEPFVGAITVALVLLLGASFFKKIKNEET